MFTIHHKMGDDYKEYEIDITAIKGYISTDPFQPNEPDEFNIEGIYHNGKRVSHIIETSLIDMYEDALINKLKDVLMEGIY